MTVDEIFSELSAQMLGGLMVHNQMANYYGFLGLPGYSKCHLYHYWSESKEHVKLMEYFFKYHNKLIRDMPVEDPKLIPKVWYNYEMKDVDVASKRNAVKTGMEKWIEWEEKTLEVYKKAYQNLINFGEINDACYVKKLIKNVTEELSEIKAWYLIKKTQDFEINSILSEQHKKKHEYKKKIYKCCCCK